MNNMIRKITQSKKRLLNSSVVLAGMFSFSSVMAMDAVKTDASVFKGKAYSPYANRAFPAKVLFGDVHVHTGLSGDAGGGGTRLMPRDAYRFARGEQLLSNTGLPVRISQPYDFMAVADHTDGMGMITDVLSGAPNIMADAYGRELNAAFNAGGEAASKAMIGLIARFSQGKVPKALNYQPGNPAYRSTWEMIVKAAEEYNEPGQFTTLIGFEWTSLVKGNNLHRVVLMRDNGDKKTNGEKNQWKKPMGSKTNGTTNGVNQWGQTRLKEQTPGVFGL